jgi:hypothetical protein
MTAQSLLVVLIALVIGRLAGSSFAGSIDQR